MSPKHDFVGKFWRHGLSLPTRCQHVLRVESVLPCRRAINESAWREPCARTTQPWPPSCTSALCTIVKWMPLVFQRLDYTDNNRHPKLHLSAKIDGNRPTLIELWLGEFWLRNAPSQHWPSPSHKFVNICPLPSIIALKCSLWCRSLLVQSRHDGERKGTNAAQYSGVVQNGPCLHIKYSNFLHS